MIQALLTFDSPWDASSLFYINAEKCRRAKLLSKRLFGALACSQNATVDMHSKSLNREGGTSFGQHRALVELGQHHYSV